MKAIIKEIFSPDIKDLSNFIPEEFDNFCILIQTIIGPEDSLGGESFEFLLCTPKWITSEVAKERILFGKGYVFVNEYNFSYISNHLQALCSRVSGDGWDVIANKLSRFGNWEFEDFIK